MSKYDKLRTSKLSQRDIAGILQIDTKPLQNWRKNKPELYAIVMLRFRFKELLELQKAHYEELQEIEKEVLQHLRFSNTSPKKQKKYKKQSLNPLNLLRKL